MVLPISMVGQPNLNSDFMLAVLTFNHIGDDNVLMEPLGTDCSGSLQVVAYSATYFTIHSNTQKNPSLFAFGNAHDCGLVSRTV